MRTDFTQLRIWKEASDLAVVIYDISRCYPKSEMFGLTSQIRRAAVSVALYIAESTGRESRQDRAQFLSIARGSAKEVESTLYIAVSLGHTEDQAAHELAKRYRGLSAAIFTYKQTLRL